MLKNLIEEKQILGVLQTYYGIAAQSISQLFLGADSLAATYKVNTKSQSYFVKIKYHSDEKTLILILFLLHDAKIEEIIFPIASKDGKLFLELEHFKMIVYPFLDGQNGFNHSLSKNQWIQLGKTLKKIHTLFIPASIQQQLRKETFSDKWREIVKALSFNGGTDTKIIMDFKHFYQSKLAVIDRLVNSTEELSKKIPHDTNNYVLCHADIHAGNILISDSNLYIVDWDNPILAPKERDLMFIGAGVGNVWNISQEIDYFYEGYGETDIDKTLLSYYRHERIIEDIAEFSQDILSDRHDDEAKLEMFNHFKAMFATNGVIKMVSSL